MKTLVLSIIATLILATNAKASNFEGIKVGTVGKTELKATFTTEKATPATVTITNQAGVVIKTTTINTLQGTNTVTLIDAATIAAGTYTVTIVANGTTTTTSFINFGGESL
jgi:hypothetical protein